MTDQELKKFCLEIALSAAKSSGCNVDSKGLIEEATVLYNFLKL